MSHHSIAFYYDIGCPFAYIAAHRIVRLAAELSVQIEWKPVLLGGLYQHHQSAQFPAQEWSVAKAQHNLRQLHQEAKLHEVPLRYNPHHPQRTVNAMRLLLCCDGEMRQEISFELFKAYWQDGHDFRDQGLLDELCQRFGLEKECYLNPDIKIRLRKETEIAAQKGLFGVPSFEFEDEHWWGQDRMLFVRAALDGYCENSFKKGIEPQNLTLYHDFASPFSYLGVQQMAQFQRETGHRIELKPILLGALFKQIGTPMVPLFTMSQDKQQYVLKDLGRWAQWWNIPFSFPSHFPLRSVLPLRASIVAPQLTHDLYRAFWGEGKDISQAKTIAEICDLKGLPAAEILAAAESQPIKEKLRSNTQEAIEAGVCGVPSWTVKGEIWWGQDRLLSLAKYLS